MSSQEQKSGSLRELMPQTTALIDELRRQFGAATVDSIVLAGKRGRPVFYAAEIGADGVLREFGTPPSGRRAVAIGGEVVQRGA